MKKRYSLLIVAIIFLISMLGLTSCLSEKEIEVQTVYVIPELSFPKFPVSSTVLPLDENGKRVTDANKEIVNVLMPYWYWNLIIDYKLNVDEQETFYKAYSARLREYTPP